MQIALIIIGILSLSAILFVINYFILTKYIKRKYKEYEKDILKFKALKQKLDDMSSNK